ncbi:MAG: 5'-nucleotidase C-terminal domain-containing protein, partial [Thermomicrobiales bacterium]
APAIAADNTAENKDGTDAVGDVAAGDWLDVKVKLTGEREGQTAGLYVKPLDLTGDLSNFGLYYTPITRTNATYVDGGDSAGFEEALNANFPSATTPDFAPLEAGVIDEDTWAEQGFQWSASRTAYLDYIFTDLGVKPDLLMLGMPLTDEFSHQLLGLLTATDPDGNANPFFDDVNGDGTKDNRVQQREGMIQTAYQMADEHLAKAKSLMGAEVNVFATSDHGFAAAWYGVNAQMVLSDAGLSVAGCSIHENVDLTTIQVKVCASGGTANIYLNLVDRDTPGLVPETDYETVRDQIVSAFQGLKDPDQPDATVVQKVFKKEELRDVQGTDALSLGRSGDVVVVLKAPYQFDAPTHGKVIAPSGFFGQHGYLPDDVDLAHNINMHGTFLASGHGIASGKTLAGVRAIDIAPTVAYLLNIPGPTSARGKILYDALANGDSLREVTILDISDFHGQLTPLSASTDSFTEKGAFAGQADVGGVAYLKPWLDLYRSEARDGAILVTAGDAIGATPPLSAFFDDLPTIEMMNALGFNADGIGNHNFDVSSKFFTGTIMPAAKYPYLSVNVVLGPNSEPVAIASPGATPNTGTGTPWAPSATFEFNGVTLGLIGFTNDDVPSLTRPGALGPFIVTDPVAGVNAEAGKLRGEGIPVVVAMGHMGMVTGTFADPQGPGIALADGVHGVDVVIGDHTDQEAISTRPNGVLYTEVRSKGVVFNRVRIVVDTTTGEVVYKTADHHRPWTMSVTPDPEIQGQLDDLNHAIEPILGEVVGSSMVAIPQTDSCGTENGRTCESLEGDVVADAMRFTYGSDFAVVNSGALRAEMTCPAVDNPDDFCGAKVTPNSITRGQVLGVLPFGNVAVTLEVTGAELKGMLEAGIAKMPGPAGSFPQVSGLCFTYDLSREVGDRVTGAVRQAEDGSCTGEKIDLTAGVTYKMTTNDYLVAGGDGYPNLSAKGTTREVLDEIVAAYVGGSSPFAVPGAPLHPKIDGRITCTGAGCPVRVDAP